MGDMGCARVVLTIHVGALTVAVWGLALALAQVVVVVYQATWRLLPLMVWAPVPPVTRRPTLLLLLLVRVVVVVGHQQPIAGVP